MKICLGHVTGCCKRCIVDEKNKECPHYYEVGVIVYNVKEVGYEFKPPPQETSQQRR